MKIRTPKDTDQEETQKAFILLKECMQSHPEIESTLWAGAMWSCLVDGYVLSGASYEDFDAAWGQLRHHYKTWFVV